MNNLWLASHGGNICVSVTISIFFEDQFLLEFLMWKVLNTFLKGTLWHIKLCLEVFDCLEFDCICGKKINKSFCVSRVSCTKSTKLPQAMSLKSLLGGAKDYKFKNAGKEVSLSVRCCLLLISARSSKFLQNHHVYLGLIHSALLWLSEAQKTFYYD